MTVPSIPSIAVPARPRSIPIGPVAALALTALWLLATAAGAIDNGPGIPTEAPLTPLDSLRGLRPNEPFLTAEGIESINTSNGNLMLSVPLGQEYTVGPGLSYRLRVVHNSDVWDHMVIECSQPECAGVFPPIQFALPNRHSNAGIGWELHFGKLYEPIPPRGLTSLEHQTWPNWSSDSQDALTQWLYVSPDGATHTLHGLDGRTNSHAGGLPVRYSKDGSRLRMVQQSADRVEVQHPDGRISEFRRTADGPGTLVCGRGPDTQCWRFHEMRDPHGNFVRVQYASTAHEETWTISDSTGRSHRVIFDTDDASTGGGDGVQPLVATGDDELGDLRRVLREVRLAAFDDREAVYGFRYALRNVSRGRPHDENGDLPPWESTMRVPVLEGIDFPVGEGFTFETEVTSPLLAGKILSVTGPTQGKISYDYRRWSFPTRCVYTHDEDAELDYPRWGIQSKTLHLLDGSPEGTWTYSSGLYPANLVLSGPQCSRADYRETVVDGPMVDGRRTRTVHFNSVHDRPRYPTDDIPIDEWQTTDGGLPYRKDVQIGSGGSARFLSEEIYDCGPGDACDKLRSTYVRYEMEYRQCEQTAALGDSSACYRVDPVRAAERTVFHDDGGKYIESLSLRHDGAGNSELEIVRDNFEAYPLREVRTSTDYDATGQVLVADPATGYIDVGTPATYLPAPSERWILDTHREVKVTDGTTQYVTEHQFDDRGALTCTRKRKAPGARSPQDLVTRYLRNPQGLVTTETIAGGDTANLSTGVLCSIAGNATDGSRFDLLHTYQHLQRASTRIAGFPYRYRATVDRNTGLEKELWNAQDQKTTLTYDLLGRITGLLPETSLRQASTYVAYHNLPDKHPQVVTTLYEPGGATYDRVRQIFDTRGRLYRDLVRRPTGPDTWAWSETRRAYDPYGRPTHVTTLQPKGQVNWDHSTRYFGYDPFGRASRIERPDGLHETWVYRGERMASRTVDVATSETGPSPVETHVVSDGLGRTIRRINPLYGSRTIYDPDGQAVALTRFAGATAQHRLFGRDGRGFVTYEDLPEIGDGAGNGRILFTRDALGNVRTRDDGQRLLTFTYDGAGRPLEVREGPRTWQEWRWGTANAGADRRKGRLVRAVRHNYPDHLGGDRWSFAESFVYGGPMGQVSSRTLQAEFPDAAGDARFGPAFVFGYGHDRLGRRTSVTYPSCVPAPQTGERFCNDPADAEGPGHVLTLGHNVGLQVWARSSQGPEATYAYHPNAQLAREDYSNQTYTLHDPGTAGMNRPTRIRTVRAWDGLTLFDTGLYRYDASGHIWGVGNDRYTYDAAGRLRSGTLLKAGAGRREDYTYDIFDNLRSVSRDGGAPKGYLVDAKNRYLGSNGVQDTGYDTAGNLTALGWASPSQPPAQAMAYDGLDRQTRFTLHNAATGLSQTHGYLYGPRGHRIVVIDPDGTRHWSLRDLDGRLLRQHTADGEAPYVGGAQVGGVWTWKKDFVHGPNGPFATTAPGGALRFLHRDHLGSTRLITQGGGYKTYRAEFYPYGDEVQVMNVGGAAEWGSKFTGHERDLHGRTDYMLGRTYHVPVKRFTSVDPARAGWNPYAYTRGNPISFNDPTGFVDANQGDAQLGGPLGSTTMGPPHDGTRRTTMGPPTGNEKPAPAAVYDPTKVCNDLGCAEAGVGYGLKLKGLGGVEARSRAVYKSGTRTPSGERTRTVDESEVSVQALVGLSMTWQTETRNSSSGAVQRDSRIESVTLDIFAVSLPLYTAPGQMPEIEISTGLTLGVVHGEVSTDVGTLRELFAGSGAPVAATDRPAFGHHF